MMKRIVAVLAAMLLWMPGAQAAEQALPASLEQGLEKLASLQGFTCRFEQVIYYADGGEQHYTGELAVRRPGKFRWQYQKPYAQLYISDGKVIWLYEPDLMQVQRLSDIDAIDPLVMKLLDGRVRVQDVHLLEAEKGNGIWHVAIGQGPDIWLAMDAGGNLQWLESRDALGNRNRMILENMERKAPAAATFDFRPPPGVEVIEAAGFQHGVMQ
jgi:outer membrane lipoprotein carrier protein